MTTHSFILLFFLLHLSIYAQSQVKGSLASKDTATLSVIRIFPDSFPSVSVVFKAETRKGDPVWNLTKERVVVKEDAQQCQIISLEKISKDNPIYISVVIDHSGSMLDDNVL